MMLFLKYRINLSLFLSLLYFVRENYINVKNYSELLTYKKKKKKLLYKKIFLKY